MALWMCKQYSAAAATLVEEAAREDAKSATPSAVATSNTAAAAGQPSLPDIFSFYAFLRRNPLVMRQRLTNAGVQLASTEQFLAYARDLENRVTPNERRLYFRTAAAHLTNGCPLLALDVLSMLPHRICATVDGVLEARAERRASGAHVDAAGDAAVAETSGGRVADVDWSAPTDVVAKDELQLDWGDDNDEEGEEAAGDARAKTPPHDDKSAVAKGERTSAHADEAPTTSVPSAVNAYSSGGSSESLDFIARKSASAI